MTIFNDFLFVYMETRTACVEKFARADIWSFRVEVVRKSVTESSQEPYHSDSYLLPEPWSSWLRCKLISGW